jgi:hypothetical protein
MGRILAAQYRRCRAGSNIPVAGACWPWMRERGLVILDKSSAGVKNHIDVAHKIPYYIIINLMTVPIIIRASGFRNTFLNPFFGGAMNSKNRSTLADIRRDPVLSSIPWIEIENLFRALGAKISEGSGSRIRVSLNGRRAVFHRPHPERVTDKGCVKSVRVFLDGAGIS